MQLKLEVFLKLQCLWDEDIKMAVDAMNPGIKDSWSLVNFARMKGKMKVTNELVNKDTGETFRSCVFDHDGSLTFVNFSSKLGEMSAAEISREKDNLQVVLLESGTYKLCKRGEAWDEVDLGI